MRYCFSAAFLASLILGVALQSPCYGAVINEFFADDDGGDDAEFVELFGSPGESLSGLSFIVVDGDTSGNTTSSNFNRVTVQIDFTTESIPADGFFVLGGGTTPNVDFSFGVNTLQNGSQTYALVRTADIAFDAEDDDELTEASVNAITANLIDAVGSLDNGEGDLVYFGAPDISDGTGFAIDSAQRIPNGVDTDSAADWLTESTFPEKELADTAATPGTVNAAAIPEPSSILMALMAASGVGAVAMRRRLG